MVEGFNQTLLSKLRTLPGTKKSNWKGCVNELTHAYNTTKHASTGFAPFYLSLGRHPRLPVDLIFKTNRSSTHNDQVNYPDYVKKWNRAMREAYEIESKHSKISQDRGKKRYDKHVHQSTLEEGDRVLVRNVRERGGPGKIRSCWESGVYRVVKRIEDSPVYQVVQESSKDNTIRTLHRNLLLPCNDLPLDEQNVPRQENEQRRTKPIARNAPRQATHPQHDDSELESEDELVLYVGQPRVEEKTSQRRYRPPTPYPRGITTPSPEPDSPPSPHPQQGQSDVVSPDNSFQNEMNTSSEFSDASPVPVRPQRVRRAPEVLQYTHLGKPQSFPVCNSVRIPMLLPVLQHHCMPIRTCFPLQTFHPTFLNSC